MPRLRFDAWVNGLSTTDPGHMGMYDARGGYYYEFAMGVGPPDNLEPEQGVPFGTKPDAPAKFARNVKVTDAMTGLSRSTQTKKLVFFRSRKEEYFRRQLMKTAPQSTTFRFTHLFYIEVDVTEPEYQSLILQTFTRGAGGAYNFMKEAQVKHPLTTRCLTLLETLAQIRNIRLQPGTALDVLTRFVQASNDPAIVIRNDPLIVI